MHGRTYPYFAAYHGNARMRPENLSGMNKGDPRPHWPLPRIFQKCCNASLLPESTWNAGGKNIFKNNLSSACRRLEEAVRLRGVLLECPAFIVPKFNHDSTALKTTFSLRVPKKPLFSAARTLCENAFGRTGVANRELSLYLSPVFSLASVSSSEISSVSPQQRCKRVQSSPFGLSYAQSGLTSAQSGQNSRSFQRQLRSVERTSIF